jgi:pyruvate dehydrogenase E1 component
MRERGQHTAKGHVERLLADVPRHCAIVRVIDGCPTTLAWLGAVHGHRTRALSVKHFGRTGTIGDLFCHYGTGA